MLGVSDRVTNNLKSDGQYTIRDSEVVLTHIFEEDLKNTTGLFINEARNTLHTTTAGETTDSWLGDTLDVITKDFAMTLSTTLAKTLEDKLSSTTRSKRKDRKKYLSTFSTARHCCKLFKRLEELC